MKKIILSGGAALLLLVIVTGCSKQQKKDFRERSVRVEVQKLENRTFRYQLPLQGTVMPLEHATISAKISGTVEQLKVESGDHVKAGDLLFEVDRKVLENQVVVKKDEILVKTAALESAKHAKATAEIKLKQAQLDLDRARKLDQANATSKSNFENALTAFKTAQMQVEDAQANIVYAEAQLKQARSNLDIAEKNLADSKVYAPFDCVVTETFVEENEFVSVGKNILRLENQKELEIVTFISAVYYHQVVPGQTKVEILDHNGKVLGSCKVTYKSPSVDPVSRTFKLKAVIPENVKTVSGMLCDFNLVMTEKVAPGLPADCMMLRGNGRYIVFTVDERGRAIAKDVQRGIIDGSYCEVVNFSDFENIDVVISGQTFVNNNTLLDIVKKNAPAPAGQGK